MWKRITSGHFREDSLSQLMLIITFINFQTEGHQKVHNEVEFLSPAEQLVRFEPGTFQLFPVVKRWLNQLSNSPHNST